MTEITQCPECDTRFKVSEAQLEAHAGMVRCGRCRIVFDARKHLQDDAPSPQLSLPIEPEAQLEELGSDAAAVAHGNAVIASSTRSAPATPVIEAIRQADSDEESVNALAQLDAIGEPNTGDSSDKVEHFLTPIPDFPELEEEHATLAQRVRFIEDSPELPIDQTPRKRPWIGILAASVLTLTLCAQAIYFYRVELAAKLPGLKPLLSQSCALLNCTVELPRQTDLMTIESSELQADPVQSNVITLHALLHNRATFTQAYPSLELTLNNLQDQPVARRVFRPTDYLHTGNEMAKGLAANHDLEIALRLDTTDLKPAGYRLFLFYPK